MLHRLTMLLPQLGAALEVCEQEREGLRRRLRTHQRQSYLKWIDRGHMKR
jgi:hypothetical protein